MKMNSYELSRSFTDWCFSNPEKVKPIHYAIYFFAIEHCNRLGWKDKFGFPSQMVMEAIGVKNWRTYSSGLDELVEFGFIEMIEISKNQYSSNIIAIVKNTKAHTKALDKALSKHIQKHSTKHSQSTVSIDKQLNNITRNKEQEREESTHETFKPTVIFTSPEIENQEQRKVAPKESENEIVVYPIEEIKIRLSEWEYELIENSCKVLKITVEEYKAGVDLFLYQQGDEGMKKDYTDVKKHFRAWLKNNITNIHKSINNQNNSNGKPQKKSEVSTSKPLNEITPLLKSSSVKSKIAEIMIGKPITKDEFLENLNRVLLICTIKAELSDIEIELIKDTFRLKYADKLTSNEFLTAFQFNQAGLLPLRVEHYQVFGIEFMTKVLDAYLIERHNVELKNIETQKEIQLNEAERQREITETNQNNMVLKSIINDYYLVSKSIPIELSPFFKLKFSVFNEMAEIDLTDEKVEKINALAIASAIQKRSKRLTEIVYDESKYGEKLNLKREIEQLRNGKWSDKIETELKLIFEFELYKLELGLLPDAFCKHVESHLI